MSESQYSRELSDILDPQVDSSYAVLGRIESWLDASSIVMELAKHSLASQQATTQQLAKQRKIADSVPEFATTVSGTAHKATGAASAPSGAATTGAGASTGTVNATGISRAFSSLAANTDKLYAESDSVSQSLKQAVIPPLEQLMRDLKDLHKHVGHQHSKSAKEVEKQRESTLKQLEQYERSLTAHAQRTKPDPKMDPYVLHCKVRSVAATQIQLENHSAEANLSVQENFRSTEQHVILTLQNAISAINDLQQRFYQQGSQSTANINAAFKQIDAPAEWLHFTSTNSAMLTPSSGFKRDPTKVVFNNSSHELTIPLMEGALNRQGTVIKGNSKQGYFVLTPSGFLHQFKSSDYIEDPTPVLSLFVPESELGGLQQKGTGDTTFKIAARDYKKAIPSRHRYTFFASSHEELVAWFTALSRVAGATGNVDEAASDGASNSGTYPSAIDTSAASMPQTPSVPQTPQTPQSQFPNRMQAAEVSPIAAPTGSAVPAAATGAALGSAGAVHVHHEHSVHGNASKGEPVVEQHTTTRTLVGASPEFYNQSQAAVPQVQHPEAAAVPLDIPLVQAQTAASQVPPQAAAPQSYQSQISSAPTYQSQAAAQSYQSREPQNYQSHVPTSQSQAQSYQPQAPTHSYQPQDPSAYSYQSQGLANSHQNAASGKAIYQMPSAAADGQAFPQTSSTSPASQSHGIGSTYLDRSLSQRGTNDPYTHPDAGLSVRSSSLATGSASNRSAAFGGASLGSGTGGSSTSPVIGRENSTKLDELKSQFNNNYVPETPAPVNGTSSFSQTPMGENYSSKSKASAAPRLDPSNDGSVVTGPGYSALINSSGPAPTIGSSYEARTTEAAAPSSTSASTTAAATAAAAPVAPAVTSFAHGSPPTSASAAKAPYSPSSTARFEGSAGNVKPSSATTASIVPPSHDSSFNALSSSQKSPTSQHAAYIPSASSSTQASPSRSISVRSSTVPHYRIAAKGDRTVTPKDDHNISPSKINTLHSDHVDGLGAGGSFGGVPVERSVESEAMSNIDREVEQGKLDQSGRYLSQRAPQHKGYRHDASEGLAGAHISSAVSSPNPDISKPIESHTFASERVPSQRIARAEPRPEPVTAEPVVHPVVVPVVEPVVVAEPVKSKTIDSEPVIAEPIIAEPAISKPVVAEPVIAEPVVAEPVVDEPVVVAEPVAPEPVVVETTTVTTTYVPPEPEPEPIPEPPKPKSFAEKIPARDVEYSKPKESEVPDIAAATKNPLLGSTTTYKEPSFADKIQPKDISYSEPTPSEVPDIAAGTKNPLLGSTVTYEKPSFADKIQPKDIDYSKPMPNDVPDIAASTKNPLLGSTTTYAPPKFADQIKAKDIDYSKPTPGEVPNIAAGTKNPLLGSEVTYEKPSFADQIKAKDIEYSKPTPGDVPDIAAGTKNPLLGSTTTYEKPSFADKIQPKDISYSKPTAAEVPDIAAGTKNPLLGSDVSYEKPSFADQIKAKDVQYSGPKPGEVPDIAAGTKNPLLGSDVSYEKPSFADQIKAKDVQYSGPKPGEVPDIAAGTKNPLLGSDVSYEKPSFADQIKAKDIQYSTPVAGNVSSIAAGTKNPLLGSDVSYEKPSFADKIKAKDVQYSGPKPGEVPDIAAGTKNPLLGSDVSYEKPSFADQIKAKDIQYSTPVAGNVSSIASGTKNPLLVSTTTYEKPAFGDQIKAKDVQYSEPKPNEFSNIASSTESSISGSRSATAQQQPEPVGVVYQTTTTTQTTGVVPVTPSNDGGVVPVGIVPVHDVPMNRSNVGIVPVIASGASVEANSSSAMPMQKPGVGISDVGSMRQRGHQHTHSFDQVSRDTSSSLDPLSHQYRGVDVNDVAATATTTTTTTTVVPEGLGITDNAVSGGNKKLNGTKQHMLHHTGTLDPTRHGHGGGKYSTKDYTTSHPFDHSNYGNARHI